MNEKRILIAGTGESMPMLSGLVANHSPLEMMSLLDARKSMATTLIDLFLIDVHFDESRSMELLREIRQRESFETTPIILVRTQSSISEPLMRRTADALKRTKVIYDYFEMNVRGEYDLAFSKCVRGLLSEREHSGEFQLGHMNVNGCLEHQRDVKFG